MNPQYIDWENKFGKPWHEMDDGERWVAVLSTINELKDEIAKSTKAMASYQDTIKSVATHKLYFKLIGLISCSALLPVLVWLIITAIGG